MKLLTHRYAAWACAVALLLLPVSAAQAQNAKPVMVLSLASVEENLADIGYITRAAGMEDAGKTAILFGNAFTSGLDKKRPAGMYIVPVDGDFHGVTFVPVSDLSIVLETFKEQIGEPRDAGDGVKELGQGQTFYLKEANGWAFVAQSKEHLTNLPADPAAVLGDLPRKYNVALRVFARNIPAELKKLAVDQIRVGFERGLEAQPADEEDQETIEKIGRNSIKSMVEMIEESDEILLGLAIDAATKSTYLDINFTAMAGSNLARKMAVAQNSKSAFTGFLMPGASVTFHTTSNLPKETIEQFRVVMEGGRKAAYKGIDNDPDVPAEKRDAAKQVVGQFLDVVEQTIGEGRIDGGAALMLQPKSIGFVGGMLVSDGQKLDAAFKRLLELAKDEPDFPQVQLNAAKHGGVTFHYLTATIPEREAEARELLGEKLNIVIGAGPKSAYVAFGKDAEGLLRQVIDQSATGANQELPSLQANVSLLPILKFIESVDENPQLGALVKSLEQTGNDRISLTAKVIERGVSYRLEIEDGVVKILGEAGRRLGGGNVPALQGF